MITILIFILCSFWSLLILDHFKPYKTFMNKIGFGEKRKLVSEYKIVDNILDYVYKVLSCSCCFSSYLFVIVYLIIFGSMFGFFYIPIQYFLTFYIKENILVIKLYN